VCLKDRLPVRLEFLYFLFIYGRPSDVRGKLACCDILIDGGKCNNYDLNKMIQQWASRGMIILQPDYPLTEEMRDPYIGTETAGYKAGFAVIGLGHACLIRVLIISARSDVRPESYRFTRG